MEFYTIGIKWSWNTWVQFCDAVCYILIAILLSFTMLSDIILLAIYAERHNLLVQYTECHSDKFCYADCRSISIDQWDIPKN